MKPSSGFRKNGGMNLEEVQCEDLDWIYETRFSEQWRDL